MLTWMSWRPKLSMKITVVLTPCPVAMGALGVWLMERRCGLVLLAEDVDRVPGPHVCLSTVKCYVW